MDNFEQINKGFNSTFILNKLTIGLVVPIQSYPVGTTPEMDQDVELIQLAEELGFSAVWLRDIPFNVPSFGDVGQMYDPFVYLAYLAAKTNKITLGIASVILPLRHPTDVAKSAASIDQLSNGRLVLGIASGDRPDEYPVMGIDYHSRGESFQEAYEYVSKMAESNPKFLNKFGSSIGVLDMLPKPTAKKIPMLITGASQQSPEWVATHTDGLITYPREIHIQKKVIDSYRENIAQNGLKKKPVSQSLYLDLVEDEDVKPQKIHLGYKTGTKFLKEHLKSLEEIGVNHVALNLRFNQVEMKKTLQKLADEILIEFL